MLPLGGAREFTCTSPSGGNYVITWLVNTSSAVDLQFQTYTVLGPLTVLGNGSVQRNLTITVADNGVEFNNTRIRCLVVNSDDVFASFESLNFIIIIQGTTIVHFIYIYIVESDQYCYASSYI